MSLAGSGTEALRDIDRLLGVTDIDDFAKAIEASFEGKAMVLHRMRLSTTLFDKNGKPFGDREGWSRIGFVTSSRLNSGLGIDWQVMNEVALHRGSSPHLNTIDIFVDGQHLTEAVVCILFVSHKIYCN